MKETKAPPREFDHKCELCGTPVKTVGHTTMSYQSAYAKAMKEIEDLKSANRLLNLKVQTESTTRQMMKIEHRCQDLHTQAESLAEALEHIERGKDCCGKAKPDARLLIHFNFVAGTALKNYKAFKEKV